VIIMNKFWLKIALFAVLIMGLVFLIKVFSSVDLEVKTEKTIYDVWEQDDKRLRAEPEVNQRSQRPERRPARLSRPNRPAAPNQPQFRELLPEEKVRAEKLFEMALFERKKGRLPIPGMGFKKMVDYCREIIQKYPDSLYAPKARKMLRDIPERYRKRYKITNEEMGL